jgi:hypothetical protein
MFRCSSVKPLDLDVNNLTQTQIANLKNGTEKKTSLPGGMCALDQEATRDIDGVLHHSVIGVI